MVVFAEDTVVVVFAEDTVVVVFAEDTVVVVFAEDDEAGWRIVVSSELVPATTGVSALSTSKIMSLKAAFSSLLRECQCSLNFSLMPSMLSCGNCFFFSSRNFLQNIRYPLSLVGALDAFVFLFV